MVFEEADQLAQELENLWRLETAGMLDHHDNPKESFVEQAFPEDL